MTIRQVGARFRVRAALLLALFCVAGTSSAQSPSDENAALPRVTRAYAIENARIVTAPGREIERGTVVVRNGLIESVGSDARVPSDAWRIAGDSLVVYPGFIDGLSMAGIPSPGNDDQARERVERPGDPPYDRAGIEPHRQAAAMLSAGESSISDLRQAGFTAAHVVPHGRSMPGAGAVVTLSGDDPRSMVLASDASLLMQFTGARGVYPATDMAVMARIRQLYREAEQYAAMTRRYAEDPRGLERPPADQVLEALAQLVDGSKPLVFYTEGNSGALQIHRALELQRQLGFQLILAGANQAFEVVDELREAGLPVLLTLALPEDPDSEDRASGARSDSARATTPPHPSSHFVSDFRTHSHADVGGEKENLMARQRQERERYARTAADLHAAGITFGFSTRDVKARDIHRNIRLMVEHGLPEDAALAALTTNAATILGIERSLGTIEAGKIANLVLTDGPLFASETTIRQVFVDGVPHEIEQQRPRRDTSATPADPAGEWAYTASTEDAETTGVLSIRRSNGSYTGTITIDGRPGAFDITDPELDGRVLTFSFEARGVGTFAVRATLSGDTFSGSFDIPDRGTVPMTGHRMFGPSDL